MTNETYVAIRQAIVAGELKSGAPLLETALAKEYGVSRTPVREALKRLEHDGLVERAASGRMQVRVWSEDEVFDLYEVRISLEALAARLAARRHTDVDLIRLEQANEAMRAVDRADAMQMRTANLTFHQFVWRSTHNKALSEVLGRLQMQILRQPANTLVFPGRWDQIIGEHEQLIAAVREGDVESAAELATTHMIEARNIRLRIYADSSGSGSQFDVAADLLG